MPKKTREVDPFSLDDGVIYIREPDTGITTKYASGQWSKGQGTVVTAPAKGSKRQRRRDGAEEQHNAAILGDTLQEQPQVRRKVPVQHADRSMRIVPAPPETTQ